MKKIAEFFKNILLTIVYPDRLLTLFRVRNLDQNSNRVLGNDAVLKALALIVTITFVLFVRYTPAQPTTHQTTVTVNLTRSIDVETYTYAGSPIPASIDIILAGDRTALDLFVASGELTANLNLYGLEPGTHDNVVINLSDIPLGITATPSVGVINGIIIDLLVSETFFVRVVESIPEFSVRYLRSDIVVEPAYVTVTGPQRFVNQINEVQVNFDISDEEITTGIITRPGLVRAQDVNLDNISGIEFDQRSVEVRVEFYENVRTLPLRHFNPTSIPSDINVIRVVPNITEIQVWGNFERLPAAIDLPRFSFDNLDEEGGIVLAIPLPPGLYSDTVEVELVVIYEEVEEVNGLIDEP